MNDKNILGEIFKIGLPSSFNQILMGSATIVANNIAILYGTETVAGMILSISRQGILYIPLLLLLNKTLGFNGFIYAQPITDIIMTVLSTIFIINIFSKELSKTYSKEDLSTSRRFRVENRSEK